jgi:hypothetical protein
MRGDSRETTMTIKTRRPSQTKGRGWPAGVLILIDLPQPSDYAAEGYRVLWTLCGVVIGVLVMLLAGLLAKRTANAPP